MSKPLSLSNGRLVDEAGRLVRTSELIAPLGVAAGPPVSGTWQAGDWGYDAAGVAWFCTAAGTPGTWVDASSSGKELDVAESTDPQSGITTATDLSGLSIDFTVGSRPVVVRLHLPYVLATAAATLVGAQITDAAGVATRLAGCTISTANTGPQSITVEERITTPGSYTRKAQMLRIGGTGTCANNYPGGAATVVSSLSATER